MEHWAFSVTIMCLLLSFSVLFGMEFQGRKTTENRTLWSSSRDEIERALHGKSGVYHLHLVRTENQKWRRAYG
jgi:hypothetical protein